MYLEGESTACYFFIPSMLLRSLDKGISSWETDDDDGRPSRRVNYTCPIFHLMSSAKIRVSRISKVQVVVVVVVVRNK